MAVSSMPDGQDNNRTSKDLTSQDLTDTGPEEQLDQAQLDAVAGGLKARIRGGGDGDLDDLEVERLV